MGVVEYRVLAAASSLDTLARLDSFAAMRPRPTSDPEIGGFRFVRAKNAPYASLVLRRVLSGLANPLPLLLISLLVVVVVARPSSEPYAAMSRHERQLARLNYMQPSLADQAQAQGPARLEFTALVEAPFATGASPITTSALPSAADAPAREVFAKPAHLGLISPRVETLADAPPRLLRLATAASDDGEILPLLPIVEVATPEDAPEAAGIEPTHETARPENAAPRRATSKSRSARARRAHKAGKKTIARAPRWAKQMFDNPWQSSAFSYVR